MNKLPPLKNPRNRSVECEPAIPGAKKVSARPGRKVAPGSAASILEAEVETWVNEGGAGDEPGNASPPSTVPK